MQVATCDVYQRERANTKLAELHSVSVHSPCHVIICWYRHWTYFTNIISRLLV